MKYKDNAARSRPSVWISSGRAKQEGAVMRPPVRLIGVNPKFCVNSIWGANRAKFIQGGSRGIGLLPC